MEKGKTMDLVILITISQNKKVSTEDFHHLFEHEWKDYRPRFDEMAPEGIFKIVYPIPGVAVSIYELTGKGKFMLTELLQEREHEVEEHLAALKHTKVAAATGWRAILSDINALINTQNVPDKMAGTMARSDYSRLKSWLHSRLHRETAKG
jgi:hypothetical protein